GYSSFPPASESLPWVTLISGAAAALQAAAGRWIYRRWIDTPTPLDGLTAFLRFLFGCAIASTLIGATIGVLSHASFGLLPSQQLFVIWKIWWAGDAT